MIDNQKFTPLSTPRSTPCSSKGGTKRCDISSVKTMHMYYFVGYMYLLYQISNLNLQNNFFLIFNIYHIGVNLSILKCALIKFFIIFRMKNNKSTGPDELPIDLIKLLKERGINWMTLCPREIMRNCIPQ